MTSDIHADGFGDAIDFSHQGALDNLLAMLDAASGNLPLPITPGIYADREGALYYIVFIIPTPNRPFPVIGFAIDDVDCDLPTSWTLDGSYHLSRDVDYSECDLVKRIGDLPQ